jgi:uncharacterized RDD family membrane protein YckC
MADSPARKQRQKENRARREALKQRKKHADRRRKGLEYNEDEADIAPIWRRVCQYVIDQMLFAVCALFTLFIFSLFSNANNWPPIVSLGPQVLFGLVYMIPIIATKGQSYGMRVMKIMTLRIDGTGFLSTRQSFIRWLILYAVPNAFIVILSTGADLETQAAVTLMGIVLTVAIVAPVVMTKNRQGIHDLLSGSVLISTQSLEVLEDPNPTIGRK